CSASNTSPRRPSSRPGASPPSSPSSWERPPRHKAFGGGAFEARWFPAARLGSRLEEGAEIGGGRVRLLLLVVVRDEDALRPGEDPSAPLLLDLVAQRERGVPDFRWPDRHLDLIAPRRLRLEIDFHMGQNEVDLIERPTVRVLHVELRPCELDVGQVDGVVDMAHPVDVAKS